MKMNGTHALTPKSSLMFNTIWGFLLGLVFLVLSDGSEDLAAGDFRDAPLKLVAAAPVLRAAWESACIVGAWWNRILCAIAGSRPLPWHLHV